MVTTNELLEKKCRHQQTGLHDSEIADYLSAVDGWVPQEGRIVKSFDFKNFHETLAFVNAIAYLIQAEDHHPELNVTYNRCIVKYTTHSVDHGRGGITENDFICAAKMDAIFLQSFS